LAGVTVSCGVISFDVDLVPATRKNADKRAANNPTPLTRVCPRCEEGTLVRQRLVCENGHGPIAQNELDFAVEVGGELVKVDPEVVAEAKAPTVEAKTVAFSVFPAAQVEAVTLPNGNVYRMRLPAKPTKATLQAYALMRELVADGDLAFLAELIVKGVSKLYRGVARDGMITLVELFRPSLFHEPDGADADCDERMVSMGRSMVADMVTPFDAADWENAAEARLEALQIAAEAGSEVPVPTELPPTTAAAESLLALLRSAA
jgi:non-homologous end joining protein Ku